MTTVDIDARIPNNVDLAGDRRLQRALESWQPRFIEWWKTLGPVAFQDNDVYLRTAVSVGQEGWANFGHVKMPDYRWGIFLADPEPDRCIGFGDHLGEPVWQEVPGEYRADLRRLVVVQGDTEPASVEQQRALCLTAPEPLRPAQPVPGQRRGGPPPLGHGVPAAPLLRSRRPRRGRRDARAPLGRPRPSAHPRRLQRADTRLAVVLLLHLLHRPRRQVPAGLAAGERLRSALADVRLHAEGGGPPHVRRGVGRGARGAAHGGADEGARHRGREWPFGGIDVATLQRYLNFHYSVSLDLFGAETSTNAANYFAAGLKGRFQEEKRDDDHRLHDAVPPSAAGRRRADRQPRGTGVGGAQRDAA